MRYQWWADAEHRLYAVEIDGGRPVRAFEVASGTDADGIRRGAWSARKYLNDNDYVNCARWLRGTPGAYEVVRDDAEPAAD